MEKSGDKYSSIQNSIKIRGNEVSINGKKLRHIKKIKTTSISKGLTEVEVVFIAKTENSDLGCQNNQVFKKGKYGELLLFFILGLIVGCMLLQPGIEWLRQLIV